MPKYECHYYENGIHSGISEKHITVMDLLPSLFSHMLVLNPMAPEPGLIEGLTLLGYDKQVARMFGCVEGGV